MYGEMPEELSQSERLRLVVPKEKLLIPPHRRPTARLDRNDALLNKGASLV